MRYYVISADNNRYGPADLATLNQWAAEGRLLPHQMVEDASTGIRMAASSIAGISFPQQQGYIPPGQSAYGQAYFGDNGSKDLNRAWVFGAIGLVCGSCCIGVPFSIMGIMAASSAEQKGNPSAGAAKIFNIVVLVLSLLGMLGVIPAILGGASRGLPGLP